VPPARTDIANYSARLAAHLQKFAEVTFCYPDDAPRENRWPAKKISQLHPSEVNQADLCVYNLGNDAEFHCQIFQWACLHPGLVVLHERAIHEFFLGYLGYRNGKLNESSVCRYLETMAYWYGEPGLLTAIDVCNGKKTATECSEDYPLYEIALSNALAVLTHNSLISPEISEIFPLLPVLYLPLPYSIPSHAPPQRKGLSNTFRLIVFGYLGANRRLVEFIQAWSKSPWRERFTLDIAGTMFEQERFDAAVSDSGLGSRIFIHGFVSEEKLDRLLRQADLAINLRFPTMGEASGSQLRIWANRLASVVTNVGWYGQLPDETVIKVSNDEEQEDLLHLFEQLVNGDVELSGVADAGWKQLQDHAADQYVDGLMKWYDKNREKLAQLWSKRKQITTLAREQAKLIPGNARIRPPQLLFDDL
jgi:hypothetical protein